MSVWTIRAKASCDISLDVTVSSASEKLLVVSVGGSSSVEGDNSVSYSSGADVLSEAIFKSVRDAMERYAERLCNSQKLRKCFKMKKEQVIGDEA